jgi:hypothetical protein
MQIGVVVLNSEGKPGEIELAHHGTMFLDSGLPFYVTRNRRALPRPTSYFSYTVIWKAPVD